MEKKPTAFDINILLKPYREGGTKTNPIRRTLETMYDWLLHKKKYPLDVAGAGLFIMFHNLRNGKVYKGDGSYGSPGREMVTNLRFICDGILRKKLRNKYYKQAAKGKAPSEVVDFMAVVAVDVLPFFLRPFSISWWKIIGTVSIERITTGF